VAAQGGSAVILAIGGNTVLTVIKFGAYLISGSGAMLAEAVHSAADLGNQTLLWVGMKKSQQGPSEQHHFGYGKDRFLWALVSAAGIFFIGCGVSVTHGLHGLFSPGEHHGAGLLTWIVLGIALVVDGVVLAQAIRELNAKRPPDQPWLTFLRTTDDTTTLAVLFEDGAACLGVIMAAIGIGLSEALHLTWIDSVTAILIGLLLGAIALFLGAVNRAYLLDRAVSADVQARVLAAMRGVSKGSVADVAAIKTRVVGQDVFSFAADVEFDGRFISDRIQRRMNVRDAYETLTSAEDLDRLMDEHARVVVEELGNEVDRIEKEVRAQVPGARFIQLEVE
jgi:zinc transporter 9